MNRILLLLLSSFSLLSQSSAPITIATWNIRDFGGTKNNQEIRTIAEVIRNFDLIAIQEVVAKDPAGAKAVARLVDELNRMGSKWDYRVSDPTQSPSSQMSERYAFIWKTSKVKVSAPPFLDSANAANIFREPYIGKFKTKENIEFWIVNYHARRFDSNPQEEIELFDEYQSRLKSDRVIIAGDFNTSEDDPVFSELYELDYQSVLNDEGTTLKQKCKEKVYVNHAIDNIYIPRATCKLIESDAYDFVGDCDKLEAARFISDHLPVYGRLLFKDWANDIHSEHTSMTIKVSSANTEYKLVLTSSYHCIYSRIIISAQTKLI